MMAHTPHTTSRLNIFEPTTLLIANELLPASDAVTLTEHSGRLVPMATTVIPTIREGTRSCLAILALPSTKKSAPLIRKTKPIISRIND